ncbi:hypothetical protein M404DRAFT_996474 [Pisolithus tinctorius Marx 270]|uniref:Uncharacterized protein n=1 Tax=Pisolithus tinctorius Marx 270 TaxID=870435 RepID=A0A0C3KJ88_PISTI|nr:hypothetical protein M404DRAFT_996474 [Pisolithus tinctorius Marx 270]
MNFAQRSADPRGCLKSAKVGKFCPNFRVCGDSNQRGTLAGNPSNPTRVPFDNDMTCSGVSNAPRRCYSGQRDDDWTDSHPAPPVPRHAM